MITLDVEYLSYEQIAKIAEEFLNKNSVKSIPVPIEDIIDINYNIDIIPILELYTIGGVVGLSECSSISVDEFIYNKRPYRYRFTLAHEMCHFIFHKEYHRKCKFNSITKWKDVYEEIDESDRSKLEFQGYAFGGLVLVPRHELITYVKKSLPKIKPLVQEAQKKGVEREHYLSYAKEELAAILSRVFEVSTEVLTRRIDYDKLEYLIP